MGDGFHQMISCSNTFSSNQVNNLSGMGCAIENLESSYSTCSAERDIGYIGNWAQGVGPCKPSDGPKAIP